MSEGFIDRARSRLRWLWGRLRDEHASPGQIGRAIAVGVFVGCTPALGFHGVLALGGALLFRLNKIWTWVGSRVSNVVVLPWIALAEIEVAHRLRTGAWAPVTIDTVLARGDELLLDWILGAVPIGVALGAVLGLLAYGVARYRAARGAPPRAG